MWHHKAAAGSGMGITNSVLGVHMFFFMTFHVQFGGRFDS
jgi:hypothetical protein